MALACIIELAYNTNGQTYVAGSHPSTGLTKRCSGGAGGCGIELDQTSFLSGTSQSVQLEVLSRAAGDFQLLLDIS